jgi:hypothetical protein
MEHTGMEFTNGFLFGAGATLAFGVLWLLFILSKTRAFWICVLVVFLVVVQVAVFEYIQAHGDFIIAEHSRDDLAMRLYNWVRSLNLAEFLLLSLAVYAAIAYGWYEEGNVGAMRADVVGRVQPKPPTPNQESARPSGEVQSAALATGGEGHPSGKSTFAYWIPLIIMAPFIALLVLIWAAIAHVG